MDPSDERYLPTLMVDSLWDQDKHTSLDKSWDICDMSGDPENVKYGKFWFSWKGCVGICRFSNWASSGYAVKNATEGSERSFQELSQGMTFSETRKPQIIATNLSQGHPEWWCLGSGNPKTRIAEEVRFTLYTHTPEV